MGAGAIPLAFGASIVSILSPCVPPILPIVLGAASEHRFGPAVPAAGLAISFVVNGLRLPSATQSASTSGFSYCCGGTDHRDRGQPVAAAPASSARRCRRAGCEFCRHVGAAQQRGLGGEVAVG